MVLNGFVWLCPRCICFRCGSGACDRFYHHRHQHLPHHLLWTDVHQHRREYECERSGSIYVSTNLSYFKMTLSTFRTKHYSTLTSRRFPALAPETCDWSDFKSGADRDSLLSLKYFVSRINLKFKYVKLRAPFCTTVGPTCFSAFITEWKWKVSWV